MRSRRAPFGWTAALLASCAACAGEEPPAQPPPVECWASSPPHVAVGEAELGGADEATDAFVPLAEDEEVDLIAGPQGGYHILVRPRLRGLVPVESGRIDTMFAALLDGETRVDPFECPHHPVYAADPVQGDYLLGRTTPLIIQNERVPDVVGQPLLLRVEALDHEGSYARDERRVIPRLVEPPDAGTDAAPPDGGPSP